ncbi:MAG: hypothetical protein ACRDUY_12535 [Nitriliruptorales bacterium]
MAVPAARFALLATLAATMLVGAAGSARADDAARDLLERAFAGSDRPFEGRLVVVTLQPDGPTINEMEIARTADGTLLRSGAQAWMVGHLDGETLFGDPTTGRLLRLGGGRTAVLSPTLMEDKYDVAVERSTRGPAGSATVVVVREEGRVRERFVIDDESAIVVRRETFDLAEKPVRLVAFTSLDLVPVELPTFGTAWAGDEVSPAKAAVTVRGTAILREVGWTVPAELPGGFRRVDVAAIAEGDGSALRLLYSDGLYSLSVYEQLGRLDADALVAQGAEHTRLGSHEVYKWTGSEPAPHVWTGDGYTFTAISDAPPDLLATALAGLPHEGNDGILARLRRGIARLFDWLSPWN